MDFAGLMQAMKRADPADGADMMTSAAAEVGGANVVVYLVDFEQEVLEPLPDRSTHDELPHAEEVATTIAGRAFLRRRATTAERPGGTRVWVPIIEGTDPTGVLALTLPEADPAKVDLCEELGVLAGYLTQARVGGDCFDCALNGAYLDLAVMDSMGHGLRSAMVAALAMGCYRHDRREGWTLERIHRNLDAIIANKGDGEAFVTGEIGRLDLNAGVSTWINAGHPPPLLVPHGRVVDPLDATPALPWALGPSDVEPTTTALERRDSVLF